MRRTQTTHSFYGLIQAWHARLHEAQLFDGTNKVLCPDRPVTNLVAYIAREVEDSKPFSEDQLAPPADSTEGSGGAAAAAAAAGKAEATDTHKKPRLLFIPYLMDGRWISLLLHIKDGEILSASYCDTDASKDSVKDELFAILQTAGFDTTKELNTFTGYQQREITEEDSAVLTVENALQLLQRHQLGDRYSFKTNDSPEKTSIEDLKNEQSKAASIYLKKASDVFGVFTKEVIRVLSQTLAHPYQHGLARFLFCVNRTLYRVLYHQALLPHIVQGSSTSILSLTQDGMLFNAITHAHTNTSSPTLKLPTRHDTQIIRARQFEATNYSEPYAPRTYTINDEGHVHVYFGSNQNTRRRLQFPIGIRIAQIEELPQITYFLTETGGIYTCTLPVIKDRKMPDLVMLDPSEYPPIREMVRDNIGGKHLFFLTHTGEVFASGRNECGVLGLRNHALDPEKVTFPPSFHVQKIVTSMAQTFFLGVDGTVFACGDNSSGALGLGSKDPDKKNITEPTRVNLPDTVEVKAIGVSSLGHRSFFLTENRLFICGHNPLVDESSPAFFLRDPIEIPLPKDTHLKQVILCPKALLILTEEGKVYAYASGTPEAKEATETFADPIQIPDTADLSVLEIMKYQGGAAFLTDNGYLYFYNPKDNTTTLLDRRITAKAVSLDPHIGEQHVFFTDDGQITSFSMQELSPNLRLFKAPPPSLIERFRASTEPNAWQELLHLPESNIRLLHLKLNESEWAAVNHSAYEELYPTAQPASDSSSAFFNAASAAAASAFNSGINYLLELKQKKIAEAQAARSSLGGAAGAAAAGQR